LGWGIISVFLLIAYPPLIGVEGENRSGQKRLSGVDTPNASSHTVAWLRTGKS